MNPETRLFFRRLFVLASVAGLLIIALILVISPKYVSPVLPFLLIFHTAATLVSYLFIQHKTQQAPHKFVNVYLANTTIKLLLYLVILMAYSLTYMDDAVNFIISFFVLYLIFTVFEVMELVKITRKAKQ